MAAGSLVVVAGVIIAIILTTTGGGSGSKSTPHASATKPATTSAAKPGSAAVPILTYHVINSAPAGSGASPDLYVPGSEFTAQMQALKAAGWQAITLDQLELYWSKGTPLPAGKPVVVTFDGGYASQFVNALPVLKGLGWKGVLNLPSNGRSPTDGGLTDDQARGLVAAGWELDAGGNDTPDLTSLDTTAIVQELKTERQTLQTRFKAPVNWFSYASGRYNAAVTAAVSEAGFTGATTSSPGLGESEGRPLSAAPPGGPRGHESGGADREDQRRAVGRAATRGLGRRLDDPLAAGVCSPMLSLRVG